MDESLIQLVTELVMAELHRSQGSSAPPASDGEAGRKLYLSKCFFVVAYFDVDSRVGRSTDTFLIFTEGKYQHR